MTPGPGTGSVRVEEPRRSGRPARPRATEATQACPLTDLLGGPAYTQTVDRSLRLCVVASLAALVGVPATPAATGAAGSPAAVLLGRQTIPPVPPKPTVVATRVGKRVRISYSFAVWPSDADRRPVVLLTAVQSSGTRYAPFMKRHSISARTGLVWQPLGLGDAPFKLYAAAYSRLGRSSPTVSVRVRQG